MHEHNPLLSRIEQAARAEGFDDPEWDTILSLLVSDQLKFDLCGCGPGTLDRGKGLLEILDKIDTNDRAWFYEPGQALRFVMCDMLESSDLAEHGGSAPGWLTDTGKEFLTALRELVMLGERAEIADNCAAAAVSAPTMKM